MIQRKLLIISYLLGRQVSFKLLSEKDTQVPIQKKKKRFPYNIVSHCLFYESRAFLFLKIFMF